jgi:hypothetical protein
MAQGDQRCRFARKVSEAAGPGVDHRLAPGQALSLRIRRAAKPKAKPNGDRPPFPGAEISRAR